MTHQVIASRQAWVQVARGAVTVNGGALGAGDGFATTDLGAITVEGLEVAEILLFDMAAPGGSGDA